MSAALIVTSEREAQRLLPWAELIARSDGTKLCLIVTQEKDGPREWCEHEPREADPDAETGDDAGNEEAPLSELVSATRRLAGVETDADGNRIGDADQAELPCLEITMRRLRDPLPDRALLELLPTLGVQLLILPIDEMVRETEKQWKGRLYRTSTCETMYLRVSSSEPQVQRITVPTGGGANANAALRRADLIAGSVANAVTAVYVQSDAGELTAEVGERVLDRYVRRAVGRRASERIGRRVVLGGDVMDGLQEALAADPQSTDLVMVGAFRHRTIRKIFFGKLASECFSGEDRPAFAAVRAGLPFGTRFQQFCERQVQRYIPQLDRESRVSLVERVQTSSNWDFDFVALICLSTCIAALGLVRNQAAVVIGAMLVAPLMTPLVGAGLAIVQGNGALIKSSLKSVLFGFLLAYVIGILVGFAVPIGTGGTPPELIARTAPGIVDLLVALVGGVAAAYAMSRPHLSSALPGVAIAAALVPPIATSGIMLARGEWAFARGSVLLFLTNIVAIILGTAISLRLVGIRDAHHHGTSQRWTRGFVAFLLLAAIGLGFAVSYKAPRTGQAAIDVLRTKIAEELDRSPMGARLLSARRTGESELEVVVESPEDELGALPEKIHGLAMEHFADKSLRVRLEVRHVVEISDHEQSRRDEEGP